MKHPQLNTLLHIGESNFYSLMSDSNRKLMAYDFKKKKKFHVHKLASGKKEVKWQRRQKHLI